MKMTKVEYNYKRLKATSQGMNVISFMCFFVSAAFTIMLMFDSASVPLKQVLSVIMAICLELAKVYFFRFIGDQAAEAERGGNLPGKYALYALTVLLFVASTFGSIHYYMKTEAEKSFVNKGHDSSYSALSKDVSSIDTQIEQLLELAKNQQAKRFITESGRTMARVNELRKQKGQAVKDVSGYKAVDTSDSFYGIVAKFFGCEQDAARGGMYLFLSILLEFCGIASAFYGSYSKGKLFDMELAAMPEGDISQIARQREPERRETGFKMKQHIPAMARMREPEPEYDESGYDQPEYHKPVPTQRKPDKKIGFVMKAEQPESDHGYPDQNDVIDALQSQLAELMAKDKARSESKRPAYPPAASKEEAVADEIMQRVESLNQKFTAEEGHDGKESSTGNSTSTGSGNSTGNSTGNRLKSKPVTVPVNEDDMDIEFIIRDYIKELFAGQKPDGSLTGRAAVARKLNIPDDVARLAHMRLKKANLIRVDGSKSFPNCSESEMIERMAV